MGTHCCHEKNKQYIYIFYSFNASKGKHIHKSCTVVNRIEPAAPPVSDLSLFKITSRAFLAPDWAAQLSRDKSGAEVGGIKTNFTL